MALSFQTLRNLPPRLLVEESGANYPCTDAAPIVLKSYHTGPKREQGIHGSQNKRWKN